MAMTVITTNNSKSRERVDHRHQLEQGEPAPVIPI